MKTTIHCDERITNIRHTIYVKLFWGRCEFFSVNSDLL